MDERVTGALLPGFTPVVRRRLGLSACGLKAMPAGTARGAPGGAFRTSAFLPVTNPSGMPGGGMRGPSSFTFGAGMSFAVAEDGFERGPFDSG